MVTVTSQGPVILLGVISMLATMGSAVSATAKQASISMNTSTRQKTNPLRFIMYSGRHSRPFLPSARRWSMGLHSIWFMIATSAPNDSTFPILICFVYDILLQKYKRVKHSTILSIKGFFVKLATFLAVRAQDPEYPWHHSRPQNYPAPDPQ